MQAVLPKTKVSKYFRHHVAKSNPENRCTFSQETHRHFLSKNFLKDLNKIKVPSLNKYPDSADGPIYQIRKSHFVNAYSVVLEMAVFEDENGKIQLTSKEKINDKYLYLIPDAILLNEKNEPILLVEFVATHKLDQKKLMKLKRLGINAVQVNVPKSSPKEIKRNLVISKNTKWIFNYEEQNTPYIQIPKEDPRRIHDVDELQKNFLKKVTSAEARNLESLYDQLEDSWNQNRTGQLNKTLNQKYEELRLLQKKLNQNWKNYEKNISNQELRDIKSKEKELKHQKENFKTKLVDLSEDTVQRDQELKEKSELLRQKQEILKNKQEKLMQISVPSKPNQMLMNLSEENVKLRKHLNQKSKSLDDKKKNYNNRLKESLMPFQKKNNKLKMTYNKNSLPYQMIMNENYRNQSEILIQLEKELNKELKIQSKKESILIKNFEEKKKNLYQNYQSKSKKQSEIMNQFEKAVLKNSIMEILKEHSEIKVHMKEFLSLMSLPNCIQKISSLSEELKKKINNKLAFRGISLEQFCIEEGIDVSNFNL